MSKKTLEKIQQQTEQIKAKLEEQYGTVKKKAQDKKREAEHYIMKNPIKSVMIAAGTGLAIGFLLNCKKCKKK